MVKTVFIGQSFLSQPLDDYWFVYYTFYGANRINASTWQVNFSKERIRFIGNEATISTPFRLNIDIGSSLRFPGFSIFIEKDGYISLRGDSMVERYKGQRFVNSVKFTDVGQDFLIVEYELAK